MNSKTNFSRSFYSIRQELGPLGYSFLCNIRKNPSFDFETRVEGMEQTFQKSGLEIVVVKMGFDQAGGQLSNSWSLWAKKD